MELEYPGAWESNFAWGLPLIVVCSVVHVLGLGFINEKVVRKVVRMLEGLVDRDHFTPLFAVGMSVIILLTTALHALEAVLWACAYMALGALPDARSAMLYSLSALTSYGHAGIFLAPHWSMMGALESLNGMLLFGLTTAFLFSTIQRMWPLGRREQRPDA